MRKDVSTRARTALSFPPGQLHLARVSRQRQRPLVERLDSFATAADARLSALQRLRRELGGACSSLLGAGEYQLLQSERPELEGAELKEALRWKVKDTLDFPVDNATLDSFDIRTEGAAAARGRQCFVVVANNAVLAQRIRLFQAAAVAIDVIDIPELAQRNVAALFEPENRGLVVLNFNAEGGLLTFTYKAELYVVRRIEIGLEQLEQADEARRGELFDRIALEVQRSIDNFERMYNFITLARLMTADLPTVPGLLDCLRNYLSLSVAALDLAEVVDFPAIPELRNPRRQAECLLTIGAAMRGEAA